MGGSGAVNGMVYTRGDRRDYAAWPEGWRWDDLVPAFAAVEVVPDAAITVRASFDWCSSCRRRV